LDVVFAALRVGVIPCDRLRLGAGIEAVIQVSPMIIFNGKLMKAERVCRMLYE